ncbi:hypothetical protein RRF57_006427 [Xylaria bambusicola]|uniref:Uncharacterized protein n=1 Tax=Xylaria bambusicola TaxID=326684 RepID=A0AAN7Z6S7_9PEZI
MDDETFFHAVFLGAVARHFFPPSELSAVEGAESITHLLYLGPVAGSIQGLVQALFALSRR